MGGGGPAGLNSQNRWWNTRSPMVQGHIPTNHRWGGDSRQEDPECARQSVTAQVALNGKLITAEGEGRFTSE